MCGPIELARLRSIRCCGFQTKPHEPLPPTHPTRAQVSFMGKPDGLTSEAIRHRIRKCDRGRGTTDPKRALAPTGGPSEQVTTRAHHRHRGIALRHASREGSVQHSLIFCGRQTARRMCFNPTGARPRGSSGFFHHSAQSPVRRPALAESTSRVRVRSPCNHRLSPPPRRAPCSARHPSRETVRSLRSDRSQSDETHLGQSAKPRELKRSRQLHIQGEK
ncbi:MAG: hypothetical protein ACI8W3_001487 [Myxococcota bacterium]|jgi:hypothetical protein